VKHPALERLAERHSLPAGAAEGLARLLAALEAEPSPPTTVTLPSEAIDSHIADSLSGLDVPDLRVAERIADLGSGAGFPGLPLAVALPRAQVDLIESTRSKCEVIERLAEAAGTSNARALPVRAEDWGQAPAGDGGAAEPEPSSGRGTYQAVTARALAAAAVLVEYAAPLLAQDGVLVAWKGARSAEEERAAAAAAAEVGLALEGVRRVVPFPDARERHVHVYRKVGPTPERYPRRAGMAAKKPLG